MVGILIIDVVAINLSERYPRIIDVGLILGGIICGAIVLTIVGWLIRHFIKDKEMLQSLFYGSIMLILALIVYGLIRWIF